jgi:hypothetical protein
MVSHLIEGVHLFNLPLILSFFREIFSPTLREKMFANVADHLVSWQPCVSAEVSAKWKHKSLDSVESCCGWKGSDVMPMIRHILNYCHSVNRCNLMIISMTCEKICFFIRNLLISLN